MRELVGEFHQPLHVGAYAGDKEQGKECHKSQQQVLVEHQSLPRNGLPFVGFNEYANGYNQQGGKDKARKDVADNAQCFLYASFRFHSFANLAFRLNFSNKLFTFEKRTTLVIR